MKAIALAFWIFHFQLICIGIVFSQNQIDTTKSVSPISNQKVYKPEILTNGFIDIINNGQVNASARFIRLFIGEPKKFAIPLSIYSGVSSNNFQNQQSPAGKKSNDHLINNFINPLSGMGNIAIEGIFINKLDSPVTKIGLLYHLGERILTGNKVGPVTDPTTGKPINFLSGVLYSGLYFQTGAWERSNAKNVGVCWIALRYILSYTNPNNLKQFLPSIETNGWYSGYSVGWGIEINSLINLKIIYYKYTKKPEIEYSLPIYQFSLNYSLKN